MVFTVPEPKKWTAMSKWLWFGSSFGAFFVGIFGLGYIERGITGSSDLQAAGGFGYCLQGLMMIVCAVSALGFLVGYATVTMENEWLWHRTDEMADWNRDLLRCINPPEHAEEAVRAALRHCHDLCDEEKEQLLDYLAEIKTQCEKSGVDDAQESRARDTLNKHVAERIEGLDSEIIEGEFEKEG